MKQNRKDNFIIIRVTKIEKDYLVKKAEKLAVSITDLIRRMLDLNK